MNPFNMLYQMSGVMLFISGAVLVIAALLIIHWSSRTRNQPARINGESAEELVARINRVAPLALRTVPFAELPLDEAFVMALVPTAAVGAARPAAPRDPAVTTYRISSATLAAAYRYLTQRLPDRANAEPEWLLAVSGLKLPTGERTLETLIEIQLRQQDSIRAAFDMNAFTAAAVTLTAHGQALHAIFHSHRFAGAPGPSGVDLALQRQLDQGYPAIQAVFSEDGYVRFFGGARPWSVEVQGRGVVRLADDLYRITERAVLPTPEVRP